jgi:hypothetical protein
MNRSDVHNQMVPLSKSLNKRLSMYALAATGGAVGLLALKTPAEAKIIYTKANEQINSKLSLDLNHDGIADFTLVPWSFSSCCSFSNQLWISSAGANGGKNQVIGKIRSGSVNSAYALQAGARIAPKGDFHPGECDLLAFSGGSDSGTGFSSGGAWADQGKGLKNRYLGLTFQIAGQSHYGWARISVKMDHIEGTLTGYAYETVANKAIVAGKTKGPDVETLDAVSLGHLAAGARANRVRRPGWVSFCIME